MFKALLKKQLLEIGSTFLRDKKTGTIKVGKKAVGAIILFSVLFLFVAAVFGGLGFLMSPLLDTPTPWLYFALMGTIAVLYGVFGSVFNTYAGLYHAKDNELLLSMPVPPRMILAARVTGVAAMALLYGSMVLVPAIIVRFIKGSISISGIIFTVLLEFITVLFITALSCVLGWVVAVIASKLKNKSIITVLISLVVLAVYFYFCGNSSSMIESLINNQEAVASTMKVWLWPFWLMGHAAEGDFIGMIGYTLIVAALVIVTYLVMTKTFTKIVTKKNAEKKSTAKATAAKSTSIDRALLRRERMRLLSSPTYMLNCCLGSVFFIFIAVVAIIKRDVIAEAVGFITEMAPEATKMIPLIGFSAIAIISAMNTITAPSVSLEGKSIWIAQSLPVDAGRVLSAKIRLHLIITAIPAAVASVCIQFALGSGVTEIILCTVLVFMFIMLCACVGIIVNLKRPNLTWTNETIPVKQSLGVVVVLFGGWIASLALAGIYYPLSGLIDVEVYLSIQIVILALIGRTMLSWILKKGAKIYTYL